MAKFENLTNAVNQKLATQVEKVLVANGEITLEVTPRSLREVCLVLRDDDAFAFDTLMDVCGVDYADYGMAEWETRDVTSEGFSRGFDAGVARHQIKTWEKPRFAAVYHLLSLSLNQRIRVRCFCDGEPPVVDSVHDIWNSANWFEREAFDLYGILFKGHPDLRRILTDYGFVGHPFRKDFPLSGHVEMRYDAKLQRVVYEPVQIEPRVLVPKVIREDNRSLRLSSEGDN